jgi:hypothetical protein
MLLLELLTGWDLALPPRPRPRGKDDERCTRTAYQLGAGSWQLEVQAVKKFKNSS